MEFLMKRKIGALELIGFAFPVELVFGSSARAIVLMALGVGFYFAKTKFGGEFSLAQIKELFKEETHTT